jgi:dephospho-CoA kinase
VKKHVFITNGMARCGKDTFAMFLEEFVPTLKYSSIDKVKSIAKLCGWNGGKTEKDRKFLSDLKVLTSEYSDMPFNNVASKVSEFIRDNVHSVMLIDIREPEEIEKAKIIFGAKTILIKNDRVPNISSNMADANVYNYNYDFTIENNGTLEEFKETIRQFVNDNILTEGV